MSAAIVLSYRYFHCCCYHKYHARFRDSTINNGWTAPPDKHSGQPETQGAWGDLRSPEVPNPGAAAEDYDLAISIGAFQDALHLYGLDGLDGLGLESRELNAQRTRAWASFKFL